MSACSFKKLVLLLDKQLGLEDKLEVFSHLESCSICREAIYQISRDRDDSFFIYRPYNVEKNIVKKNIA
jgi:predicted anti-sigma-YlaC factor YlaD